MRTASLAIVMTLGSWTAAAAQPGQTPPPSPAAGAPMPIMQPPPPPSPPPPPPRAERSAGVGVALGVAGTILPAVAFGVGVEMDNDVGARVAIVALLGGLVLPGAGMYYAGHKKTIGQYPRSAAFVTLLLGLLIDGLGNSKDADNYYAVAGGLYVLGSGIDIAMTPGAVADYNARRAPPIAIAPIAVPGGGGLAVGAAF